MPRGLCLFRYQFNARAENEVVHLQMLVLSPECSRIARVESDNLAVLAFVPALAVTRPNRFL